MDKKIRLRVVTPEAVKEQMDVDMVIMRCKTGDLGVLHGHENCSAVLDYGVLRVLNDGTERRMAVFGGLVQIADNVVNMLTNGALWPGEIHKPEDWESSGIAQDDEDDLVLLRDQILLRRTMVEHEGTVHTILVDADEDQSTAK